MMRVIYVSAEVSPYAKSGELADVASSLPRSPSAMGMDIMVFMPKYRLPEIESLSKELVVKSLSVPMGDQSLKARIYKSELGKYDLYLIDNPKYFMRENIYGTGKGDYLDNDERFIFFNRAVMEFLIEKNIQTDIIHCNNWPTALIPLFLKTHYVNKGIFKNVATVFTLHNITYQGEFPPETLTLTGLNWNYFSPMGLSLNGKFNFLKSGIMFADVINTVSSSYKRQILTAKQGFGLEKILKNRRDEFFSIRNGIDYEIWNPQTDPYIAANYTLSNLKPKNICKKDLLKEFSLSLSPLTPVIGVVSYMTSHKGFDVLLEAIDRLMKMNVGLVVMGRGDEAYENQIQAARKRYPGKIGIKLDMSSILVHKIAAGADIILVPSRYEPCGLNQLYSFRYGTVPVVRATGGLAETVKPFRLKTRKGNGFVFKEYSPEALLQAIQKALECYKRKDIWKEIMKAGLRENFSWEKAAKRYSRLYEKTIEKKRGGMIG